MNGGVPEVLCGGQDVLSYVEVGYVVLDGGQGLADEAGDALWGHHHSLVGTANGEVVVWLRGEVTLLDDVSSHHVTLAQPDDVEVRLAEDGMSFQFFTVPGTLLVHGLEH